MTSPALSDIDPVRLGKRLQAARKARGLTQEQVAKRLGVSRTTVTAMEGGGRRPRPRELTSLAALFGCGIGELLMRAEPSEPFTDRFRSTLGAEAYAQSGLDSHVFEFQRLCEDYLQLEELCGAPTGARYPPPYEIRGDRPVQAAEDIANRERHRLGLGDAPIVDLRETLETDVGLRIFYMELPSRIAALFSYSGELGGCVAVNRGHPPERRRQTLAHEYGHFLSDRFRPEVAILGRYRRVPARERFAESFGQAFLLPATGLARRFNELYRTRSGKITPGDLCTLAHFFFVSVEAVARRLEELGLLSSGTWDRLERPVALVREPQPEMGSPERKNDREMLPTRYRYLAAEAFHRGELSEGQLARFLRTSRVEARRVVSLLGRRRAITDEGEPTLETLNLASTL